MFGFQAYKSALEWHIDNGVNEALLETQNLGISEVQTLRSPDSGGSIVLPLGKNDARAEAEKIAAQVNTLEELKAAIAAFDGIALKKTATTMVFSDGNPNASIMLVGEAPDADEDRQGTPFVGATGPLLDKILGCIGLSRTDEDSARAVYISNILNWRPPGNRTPSPAEIEVSLPFIEKHIALVRPKLLILCGGIPAQALLQTEQSVSRLRGRWHEYRPSSEFLKLSTGTIPAIVTYHPGSLLRTPAQKRSVWQDMLSLQAKFMEIDIKT
ncbi:MAG: uracil-DNA glycosylase [Alphaproteobacteria bacterium]